MAIVSAALSALPLFVRVALPRWLVNREPDSAVLMPASLFCVWNQRGRLSHIKPGDFCRFAVITERKIGAAFQLELSNLSN